MLAYESVSEIRECLARHITEPVLWQQSIEGLLNNEFLKVIVFFFKKNNKISSIKNKCSF